MVSLDERLADIASLSTFGSHSGFDGQVVEEEEEGDVNLCCMDKWYWHELPAHEHVTTRPSLLLPHVTFILVLHILGRNCNDGQRYSGEAQVSPGNRPIDVNKSTNDPLIGLPMKSPLPYMSVLTRKYSVFMGTFCTTLQLIFKNFWRQNPENSPLPYPMWTPMTLKTSWTIFTVGTSLVARLVL